ERRVALADVDHDPTDVGTAKLDLTGVKSRSHFDAQRPHCPTDRLRASHGTRRAVEGGEHAVACRVEFATTGFRGLRTCRQSTSLSWRRRALPPRARTAVIQHHQDRVVTAVNLDVRR